MLLESVVQKRVPVRMVQLVEKVVARLPRREESFADLEDQEMVRLTTTTTTTESSPAETSSSLLVEENERLRRQIEDLQTQVSVLRHRYVQQQGSNSSNKKKNPQQAPGVVLELPRAMRGGNTSNSSSSTMMAITAPLNCLRGNKPQLNRLPKDHQSFTTEDDQSTIEPGPDLEVYESSSGLKNRTNNHSNNNDFHNNATKRKLPAATSSPTDDHTRKTELLTDGSLSSDGGGGGKHYHDPDIRLMMDLESNVDEEEDTNEEGETGVLLPLRPRTTSSIARGEGRHHTTNHHSMEEEPFWRSVSDRAGWLVGLLALQSMSSFILARNEALLQNHLVIIQFLTMLGTLCFGGAVVALGTTNAMIKMLTAPCYFVFAFFSFCTTVGAGGNAGNQASVRGT